MYNHNLIEKKWQKYWLENETYKFFDDPKKQKIYILDMFPYPSGVGLHVGHPKGYTATDIIARFKRFCGFNVLHPIGWDAFGLPAEQYAINTNNHPASFTNKNIDNFRKQLQSLGFSYDYKKEVDTTDPKYYKWTQWIFSKLFEKGLAEIRDIDVNWCEELGTVLSNEEVINKNGYMVSERGEFPVIKKPMKQWVLKITAYADKLLDGLNEVNWPESLKSIQRKWIGKSCGTVIKFKTENNIILEVFTTRPDTIYGVTFLAISPEHELVSKLINPNNIHECNQYILNASKKSEFERKSNIKNQTGVFSGSYAINPVSNEKIPIYICDYVLSSYATGILMSVPAHDERDFNFAKKNNLPIKFVLKTDSHDKPFLGDSIHINSPILNDLNISDAKLEINKYLVEKNIGYEKVYYKMKDWIFSRQRYWGEPFPIIFDKNNKPHLVDDLPVCLPECKDFKPAKDGHSPLANLKEWLSVNIDHKEYIRESNTMPQWAGSCWYYLAYIMKQDNGEYIPLNSKEAYELFKKWLPVDIYVGGQEHAVLHLLYSRFWHRFLYDIGIVPTKEPFYKLINQGMILGNNGEKMSKSRGNVINPNQIVETHGADALRLYEMFMGPLTASLSWSDEGLNGVRKWLDRVYRYFDSHISEFGSSTNNDLDHAYNIFVKNVTNNIQKMNFNVAISDMMVFINYCYNSKIHNKSYCVNFLKILSCFAPHIAEELNSLLGNNESITLGKWPSFDENKTKLANVRMPIMVNGKLRDVILVKTGTIEDEVLKMALQSPKIKNYVSEKKIKKVIFVTDKIINLII